MAEAAEPEAAGNNRRVILVLVIVGVIVLYLIGRSIHKKGVIGGLASEDAAKRKQSTQTLMDWKILTDTLSRQTVPAKRRMIRTLREMNTEAAVVELIALMKDRNPTVQNESQFALQAMQPTSMQKLVDGLKNPDLNVKNRSAMALMRIGAPILQPVTKTITDADGNESQVAAVPIIEATADAASRPGVIRVLAAVNRGAVPWLLKKLADGKADAGTKACVIDILGRIGAQEGAAPIRQALNPTRDEAGALKDPDPAVRKAALVSLGRLRHPDAYGLLLAALNDPKSDTTMRSTAIVGFGQLRDPAAVSLLKDFLFGYDESLRDAAVAAFAHIGPPALPELSLLLKNERFEVRMGALRSLAGIDDPRVVGILAAALKDRDEKVRYTAADVLGRPADSAAVAPLVAALSDPAWRVASKARDSLALVGVPAIAPLVAMLGKDATSPASYYAQGAIEKIGADAVPALIAAAQGANPSAGQRAVLALGAIGDTRATRVLEGLKASGAPSLRGAAGRALKQIQEGRRVS